MEIHVLGVIVLFSLLFFFILLSTTVNLFHEKSPLIIPSNNRAIGEFGLLLKTAQNGNKCTIDSKHFHFGKWCFCYLDYLLFCATLSQTGKSISQSTYIYMFCLD